MKKPLQQIRSILEENDQAQILELAKRNKRILSYLIALTYDPDDLVAWRAISALGTAASWFAVHDLEYLRIHLRRLMWLLNDESGGIGWRAPEAMGEMIRACPQHLGEFIPILISTLDMEPEDAPPFRPGALWAIGRLAQVVPQALLEAIPMILPCLCDSDAQTRGMAVWCLYQMKATAGMHNREELLSDNEPVLLFQDGFIDTLSIAELAVLALNQPAV